MFQHYAVNIMFQDRVYVYIEGDFLVGVYM